MVLRFFCAGFIFCSLLAAKDNQSVERSGSFRTAPSDKKTDGKLSPTKTMNLERNFRNCLMNLDQISDTDAVLSIDYAPRSKKIWPVFTTVAKGVVTVVTPRGTTTITEGASISKRKLTSTKMISDLISKSPEKIDRRLRYGRSMGISYKKTAVEAKKYLRILSKDCAKTGIEEINLSARRALENIRSHGFGYYSEIDGSQFGNGTN